MTLSKKYLFLFLLFLPLNVLAQDIQVAFSPKGGATELIVKTINDAKKTIRLSAYSFTSAPIASALVAAHKRGVDVKVVLDKSQKTANYSSATFLANANIPTRINSRYKIMHNKYMVVDKDTIQTGSFNFTKAAENSNAENILVIKDKALAKAYLENWQELWDEAEDYKGLP